MRKVNFYKLQRLISNEITNPLCIQGRKAVKGGRNILGLISPEARAHLYIKALVTGINSAIIVIHLSPVKKHVA